MAIDVHSRAEGKHWVWITPADAPNEYPRIVRAVGGFHHQIGNELADILDVVDTLDLHRIGGDGRDRQRQVLKVLLPATGRHDDFFEHGHAGLLAGERARGNEQ